MQLQNDRTVELHTQGGLHYKTRIPKMGRSLAYHYPSCDAIVAATGNEVYRLNLDQGRFMTPLVLTDDDNGEILGVNVVDINPAHQLLAFGVDGNGTVQFWDHRSRTSVGTLRLPAGRLLPLSAINSGQALSITAISSRHDGLSYAIGTSSGHTLLYDIRAANPFAMKDQGYGLPIKDVFWLEGGSRMAGDGLVLSADKKVIKIWDRNSPAQNFASITPANDLNNIHHIRDSGLLLTANEGIQMCTYFIPQLGPAPRWASFLENITEEMEDQTTRSVYEDYKFITRDELNALGLDNLIGTPTLKPYMHGYFVSLKLYETARLIANPFAYAEHRERTIKEKMEKMAETRIRSKKDPGVKVNKMLAEKILRDEERAKKREEKKKKKAAAAEADAMAVDEAEGPAQESLLNDPRFAKVFEDPDFAIDVNSREYALLNPSSVAQAKNRGKTAVEDEEEESEKSSSDGLGSSESESEDESDSGDSSDEGDLSNFDPRKRPGQKNARLAENIQNRRQQRVPKVSLVPMQAQSSGYKWEDKNATFGQRLAPRSSSSGAKSKSKSREADHEDDAMEISWVPSASSKDDDDGGQRKKAKEKKSAPGVEQFGLGMEKGYVPDSSQEMSEAEKHGRTKRRHGVRSGSKNTFRRM
ncbi:WD repeat-containing protein, variant 2 [Coprinopsis cinerea AmutBmut pab1-1]|nr:WD repeat-containing protein, variant 2 [Coprinopsis cinerea AmutBmut pab1-1]